MLTRAFPLAVLLLAASPLAAQQRIGTVQTSPFVPGTARAYDAEGRFVGTLVESPFVRGQSRVYDAEGSPTGIELRDSPFVDGQVDVYDDAE